MDRMDALIKAKEEDTYAVIALREVKGKEGFGVEVAPFENVAKKFQNRRIDIAKMDKDEEKRNIPVLYDLYNELVRDYWVLMETRPLELDFRGTKALCTKDEALRFHLKAICKIIMGIKELNKDMLMDFMNGKLVEIRKIDGKTELFIRPTYIRADHLRDFLRRLFSQIKTQELFCWGFEKEGEFYETERRAVVEPQQGGGEEEEEYDERDAFTELV